ncbi:recombinase family protein [Streptomyces sp. TRM68367]|uniref:recombinase family protein n=1 Tax=Streptomyces sp. TRM68367 TaxID=2758415 RepID=UPI00165CEA71|nr:recombinase family protein [Streptomyces sp. TRM68367]MBC9725057.1 recombinase family protein [Streptomyces sp. TRM68367]
MYGFADAAYRRPKDDEVPPLQEAAKRREAGQPYEKIIIWMNEEGHRTTLGNEWRPAALASVLDNPAIAGLYEDEKGNLLPSGGPELIPPEQFRKIRKMRRKYQPEADRAPQQEYLLSGEHMVCGLCAHPLGAAPSNAGSRGHRCQPSTSQHPGGCGRVRINADLLETYVAEHVLAELAKPEVSALIEQARDQLLAEAAKLRERADDAKRRQKQLGEDYARPSGMSLQAFKAADKKLSGQANADRARARFLERVKHVPVGSVPDLVRWWKHAPLAAKQGVVVLMLEQIAVYPAASRGSRTVDADRVSLKWRSWDTASSTEAPSV